MCEIDYEKLADSVARKLGLLPPPEKIIWDAKRCAQYLLVTEKHFVDKLSKCFGFPSPIQLPSSTGSRGQKRWYAAELQDWVNKQKRAR